MSTNRFEQVAERQEDAITLFLVKAEDGARGYVTCPAAISHGVLAEDKVTAEMTAQDAFRSAVRASERNQGGARCCGSGRTVASRMGHAVSG